MRFINKYLRNLAPYKVASHRIWEVEPTERSQILKLDWNEATIPPSPNVQKRLRNLVEQSDSYFLYPSTHNKRILELLSKYTGLPENKIQYFASSDAAHEYLVRTYVSAGDPILILGPTYDNFRLSSETQGATIYYHDLDDGFVWNLNSLINTINKVRPSLLYICNPNNPTGNVISRSDIEKILQEYPDVIILIDEAYYEFSGVTVMDLVDQYQNLFVSRTFSKAFAIANFRAGYILSHEENIAQISKIKNPKNFTTFTQEAVIGVLEDLEYMNSFVKEVGKAKEFFTNELNKLNSVKQVYKSAGNFVLVQFNSMDIKNQVFNFLTNHNIYTRNLTHHPDLEHCLRITIGTTDQMRRVLSSLIQFEAQ